MKKALKFVGFVIFTLALFAIVAAIGFYHLIRVGDFRRFLISQIEQQTGLKVRLGEADLEFGRILGITFRDVALAEAEGAPPMITVNRVTARVAVMPLLNRKLIFYEIRLQQPAAVVVRDKNGRIPLIDRLLSLPFLKSTDSRFALDLRAINITDGEIDFQDQASEAISLTTRFRDFDLRLARITGEAQRGAVQKLVRVAPNRRTGPALRFDLRTGVEREGRQTTLRAKGSVVFPEEKLETARAWWNADLRVDGLGAPMIQAYTRSLLPVKSASGFVDSQFRVEGNLNERLDVKGALTFKGLSADLPEVFPAPLTPGDGRLDLELNWRPGHLDFSGVKLRSQELNLDVKGNSTWKKANDPLVQLKLASPFVSLAIVRKYLPVKWLRSPWLKNLLGALQQGEMRLVGVSLNARLSEISGANPAGFGERLGVDAELRDVKADFPGGYLPLRGFQGRVGLKQGVLYFTEIKGDYGQSRLASMDGSYRWPAPEPALLKFSVRGEADLAELSDQLRHGLLSAQAAKMTSAVRGLAGSGRFDLAVTRTGDSLPQVEGKLTFDGARFQIEGLSLSELRGNISIAPEELKAERVRALLSGSPIQIQLGVKNYAEPSGTFDLVVESNRVKAGVITQLLLGTGSPLDPGTVRGFVRYQGPLAGKEGRKFTGTLELANVQIATPPLLQPLRELYGGIKIDPTGIDFQNIKGLLVGVPANFSGRWRYAQEPRLLFDFSAPNLDITYLISQIDTEASEFYANLQAEGKIALARGRIKTFDFSDFKSDVAIDRRVWRLKNPSMRSGNGSILGSATIADKPATLGIDALPKVQAVPMQTFLKWFEISNAEMTGGVNLTGHLQSVGRDGAERKQNLNGSFRLRIEDGIIHRMRILVQILNLLDLSRWFTFKLPDLAKQGIRFRSITGDFTVHQGVYSTENLVVDSDDLRMTGAGKIDVPKDQIDFVIAVRPFAGIDTVISYIPLIGRGIAAIKNSFLVASFNITGAIDSPVITPAPLSTLSEVLLGVLGIPKHMIGIGGGGKDGGKKDDNPRDLPPGPAQDSAPR